MYFSLSTAAVFTALTALAAAAPSVPLDARDATDTAVVWMCQNTNGGAPCQAQSFPFNKCGQLTNGYAGNVKSITDISHSSKSSPVTCTWYLTDDCSGDSYGNQDDEKLTDGNGKFAKTRSALCNPSK